MTKIDDTLSDIASLTEVHEIPEVLGRLASTYGLKTVAYLGGGTLNRALPRLEPYLAVTYSSAWIEHYRTRGYIKVDPVIQSGLRRLLPVDWDDFAREGSALRQFFGEAVEFGLGRKGISFPVHGYRGDRALFSVTADFSAREWQWARRTTFRQFPVIAAYLHDAVMRTEGVLRPLPHLSRRELESLHWTAAGKTVWECAKILDLSPHTVRCYLQSVRHKLGASSNTHAVSIALKSGLLFELP